MSLTKGTLYYHRFKRSRFYGNKTICRCQKSLALYCGNKIDKFQLVELLKNQDLLEELTKVKYEEEYLCQKSTQKEKILLNL